MKLFVWTRDGMQEAPSHEELSYVTRQAHERAVKEIERELTEATRARDNARRSEDSIRELMNCYNVGGWTDAESAMKRAHAAERGNAELVERCAKVCETREDVTGFGGRKYTRWKYGTAEECAAAIRGYDERESCI